MNTWKITQALNYEYYFDRQSLFDRYQNEIKQPGSDPQNFPIKQFLKIN